MFRFAEICLKQGFTLSRLAAFLQVAEAGGIARAAGSNAVTQSKYSRQIGELEEFFGTELFQRRGKNLILTDAGAELARVSREALSGLDDFRANCRHQSVPFSIGAGATLLRSIVAPQLGEIRTRFPRIRILLRNLRNREVISGLQDLSVDFGLIKKAPLPRVISAIRLGVMEYALYIPKALVPKETRLSWSWAVQNLPIACQLTEGEVMREQLERALNQRTKSVRFALLSETYAEIVRALFTKSYAALLPSIVKSELDHTDFVEVRIPALNGSPQQVFLAWNKRLLRLRSGAETLKNCLLELLKFI